MRVTIALNRGKDGLLALAADIALVDGLVFLFSANVRLVNFDDLAFLAKRAARLGGMGYFVMNAGQ